MNQKIKLSIAAILVLIFLVGGTIFWWRLWMYQGFVGPVPFLHWIIKSDGEFSYDLTEYEMFGHLFLLITAIYSVKYLKILGKQRA